MTWRLLGNRVLLLPILEPGKSAGGILLTNTYDKPTLMFFVVGIGPGQFVKCGRKIRWVEPEVRPGDTVFSRHWLDGGQGGLPEPRHVTREDGRGLVFVDARYIIAKICP